MSLSFLLQRLAQGALTTFLALSVVFLMLRLTPGDPALIILGDYATPELLQLVRQQYGLDRSFGEQYLIYLTRLATLDFGVSLLLKKSVLDIIAGAMSYTVWLAGASMLVTCLIGIPLGMISALRRHSWPDYLAMVLALVGIATPSFWLGLLLIYTFSYLLGWFPVQGAGEADLGTALRSLVLPSLALGLSSSALVARTTRSALLEVVHDDYVRTARAKGLGAAAVFWRHVCRNALIPILTVLGLDLGRLLGGAAVIEIVFGRPGLGKTLVDAILGRDYPLSQALIVVFLIAVVLVNLLTDCAYGLADPRVARS